MVTTNSLHTILNVLLVIYYKYTAALCENPQTPAFVAVYTAWSGPIGKIAKRETKRLKNIYLQNIFQDIIYLDILRHGKIVLLVRIS